MLHKSEIDVENTSNNCLSGLDDIYDVKKQAENSRSDMDMVRNNSPSVSRNSEMMYRVNRERRPIKYILTLKDVKNKAHSTPNENDFFMPKRNVINISFSDEKDAKVKNAERGNSREGWLCEMNVRPSKLKVLSYESDTESYIEFENKDKNEFSNDTDW